MINCFDGDYAFLSNFAHAPMVYKGRKYLNSEAAFQAQKCPSRADEFTSLPPNLAKRLGRKVMVRPDWEEVKVQEMREIIRAKFDQNKGYKIKLMETSGELIEGNYWHDNFWGACSCEKCKSKEKKNMLGKLLVELREFYLSERSL